MTKDEAERVGAICASADGECIVCVTKLTRQLLSAFPEFDWVALTGLDQASFVVEEADDG